MPNTHLKSSHVQCSCMGLPSKNCGLKGWKGDRVGRSESVAQSVLYLRVLWLCESLWLGRFITAASCRPGRKRPWLLHVPSLRSSYGAFTTNKPRSAMYVLYSLYCEHVFLRLHRTCSKGYYAMMNAEEKRCGKGSKTLKSRNASAKYTNARRPLLLVNGVDTGAVGQGQGKVSCHINSHLDRNKLKSAGFVGIVSLYASSWNYPPHNTWQGMDVGIASAFDSQQPG